jgi:hypothetical protein
MQHLFHTSKKCLTSKTGRNKRNRRPEMPVVVVGRYKKRIIGGKGENKDRTGK